MEDRVQELIATSEDLQRNILYDLLMDRGQERKAIQNLYSNLLELLDLTGDYNDIISFQIELSDPYPYNIIFTGCQDEGLEKMISKVNGAQASRWNNPALASYPAKLLILIQPRFDREYPKILLPFVVAAPGSGYSGSYSPFIRLNRKIILEKWKPSSINEIWNHIELN